MGGGNLYSWAGAAGSNAAQWNKFIVSEGGVSDNFSGLPIVHAASPPQALQYTFGPNGTAFNIDGKSVTIEGWSAGLGFIAK